MIVVLLSTTWHLRRGSKAPAPLPDQRETINLDARRQVTAIQSKEEQLANSLWSEDYHAQSLGRSVEAWWDRINASEPKIKALAEIGFETNILTGLWTPFGSIPHLGIDRFNCVSDEQSLTAEDWRSWVNQSIRDGWELENIEFRHKQFTPVNSIDPAESEYFFRAGLFNNTVNQRCLINGPLKIRWQKGEFKEGDIKRIAQFDGRSLELLTVNRASPFRLIHKEIITPPANADAIDPLLVQDIDGDGVSEIVLANKNRVLRYQKAGNFESTPLFTFPPGLISTAVFSDLNGDGAIDFLCHKNEGLVVLQGSKGGIFDQYAIMLRPSSKETIYPMILSTGDIDADGDLDIFLGQYRVPYEGGSLPTPFFDANDGYPFYLLKNNGNFQFEDITTTALPNSKQHRRIYSASLVDFDGVDGLDLMVVSDFAGADLYLNEGSGQFKEATHVLGDQHGFGMAHTFSDFNVDGVLDFLMIGMTSPTVKRLEHLQLWRTGLTGDHSMRRRMTHGNRLFLSDGNNIFNQGTLSESIAHAGWAWGCSAADFNNDGYPDAIVGNGLETRQYVQDYESEYWLHDAFNANSEPDPISYLYFKEKFTQTRGKGQSYGGYESNRLFLNLAGESFLDIGHLWGLGLQHDTRNVVTEDFDGDGRMDCLFTHYQAWPDESQVLRVYQNRLDTTANWIGFRIITGPDEPSGMGVRIQLETNSMQKVDTIITGDSYRSQHSQKTHFGLGSEQVVNEAVIQWPDGHRIKLAHPAVNQYHLISYRMKTVLNDKE